jgi:iduronate 2-sulfatase
MIKNIKYMPAVASLPAGGLYRWALPKPVQGAYTLKILILFLLTLTSFAEKKNVLFIMADDLNNFQSAYGSFVKTPHIDSLAERGTLFERAYCQYPVCGPSRISIMSGMYASTLGALHNHFKLREKWPNIKVLPQLFRENGYFTGRVSKIYHMGIPGDIVNGTAGVDIPESWDVAINVQAKEQYGKGKAEHLSPKLIHNGVAFAKIEVPDKRAKLEPDVQSADLAVKMIEENKNKPFFIAVGFVRPHVPLIAPEKFFKQYKLEGIQAPEDLSREELSKRNETHKMFTNQVRYGMNALQKRKTIQAYAASVAFMDEQVGKLLKTLKKNKLEDKTIVVFVSDHGYNMGTAGAWQKVAVTEESMRVPLVISVPGQKSSTNKNVIELIDLYPTLCKLTGLSAPKNIQGQDLSPVLKGHSSQLPKKDAFSISRNLYTLCTEQYRIIQTKAKIEIFALKDLHQKDNLYQKKGFEELSKTLLAKLIEAKKADKGIKRF